MDPPYKSRDALNTSTQNLADEPTLDIEPPVKVTEKRIFTLLLTSSGQEWQFHIATDI